MNNQQVRATLLKSIEFIFVRPLLVILISLFAAGFINDNTYAGIIICVLLLISLILIYGENKRLKFGLAIGLYSLLLFLACIYVLLFTPKKEIANQEFYSNEIIRTTGLNISSDLKLISKVDTITYVGAEGEYDAECLYEGSKKAISKLRATIISDKSFSKVIDLEEFQPKVLTAGNVNRKDLSPVFRKEEDGFYVVYVAFNITNTKIYFSIQKY
jgi:energy-coupling factor transporter transmembrane protein EcfT